MGDRIGSFLIVIFLAVAGIKMKARKDTVD
jgi:hypothetical protein